MARSSVRHTSLHAAALRKWRVVRDISDEGGTKEDACAATGLKLAGLHSLLKRHTGTWTWPIA